MKIKLPNDLIIIDSLVILLILSITFIPDTPARVILGLPFLLFFPGYVLIAALFPRANRAPEARDASPADEPGDQTTNNQALNPRGEMDSIERVALGFGMSIAVTALIGLGLNYTPWGIRLEPVLYAISAFIIILSVIAYFRRRAKGRKELLHEVNLKLPGIWEGSALNKSLNVILIVAVLGAAGTLIYTVANPKEGEKFTEFYILGINGKAADYPTEFTIVSSQEPEYRIRYGDAAVTETAAYGMVTLGIVNHEQAATSYEVRMLIDGEAVPMVYTPEEGPGYQKTEALGPLMLGHEEKREQTIGIQPRHAGDNQKVEILLYKDGGTETYLNLHLWITVN